MSRTYLPAERVSDLRALVKRAEKLYGETVAYREFDNKRELVSFSFERLSRDMDALGTKLLDMGLAGKHIAIIGESRYAYVLSYLAVVCGVGVIVPIDKELPGKDIAKLVKKADSEAIIFSDTYASEMDEILENLPEITVKINMNPKDGDDRFLNLFDLIDDGYRLLKEGHSEYLEKVIDSEKMCTIIFTSGTTGANKGVMLCHKNMTAVVYSAFSMFKFPHMSFSVLPINHSYEFNTHILGALYAGITICFNDSLKHVSANLKTFQPEMTIMVPLIVENLYKTIWANAEKNGLKKHLQYGIKYSNLIRKIGIDARKYFFKPVLEALGGKLKVIVCGGAPLRPEIVKDFESFGITVYNGYGITECAPLIASNCSVKSVPGSIGIRVPVAEVRIDSDSRKEEGEIQVKGDNVMLGYYKDEQATKDSFTDDGWFKTGDIGVMNKKGVLSITGRQKNLIILANGKNVHPEEIEEYMQANIPYIKEIVVSAPSQSSTDGSLITASVYLDPKFVNENGLENAKKMVEADIRQCNKQLAPYKRIHKTIVRETEFEKTTTLKIKRHKV